MTNITLLLDAARGGDRQAASDLLPLVYEELRRLARARMAEEQTGQTLDATALVHEAYLRLVGEQQFEGRGHFFAAAAEAMRRIQIEAVRRKKAVKHGGDRQRELFTDQVAALPDEQLLALNEALDLLQKEDETVGNVVKLRFFVGLTIEETANALGISVRTTNRHWTYARAWLFDSLTADDS